MNRTSQQVQWSVWGGLVLIVLTLGAVFMLNRLRSRVPPLPVLSQVSDFSLTNHLGETVSLEALRGKVWVGDIIFSRCAGPCPEMTRRMAEVQAALPANQPVQLISLTTDPEFDTPIVLKRYAERFGAQSARWWFLTGSKEEIARLAIDGLKLTALEKTAQERANPNDLFIHSTLLVVVDTRGQLRAVIEAMEPGAKERTLQAVRALLRESKS